MADLRTTNRAMFWRILRRLFSANPGRLSVMLLALGAGAAVTAALLNLQIDAKRRLTTEFRAFGPNVLLAAPARVLSVELGATISESVLLRFPYENEGNRVGRAAFLYVISDVTPVYTYEKLGKSIPLVVAGYRSDRLADLAPSLTVEKVEAAEPNISPCFLGEKAAAQLQIHAGNLLLIKNNNRSKWCQIHSINSYGGPEDNQVFVALETVQRLAGTPGRISLIQLSVPGAPHQIDRYIADIQKRVPDVEVRPIRQFTEGEAKIYNRISGLLTATVGIVLLLTGLCVMAAMTNVAMERKNDVGLMKAIGGSMRHVLRLFLAEAALLGLSGGLIGAAAGIFLSIGLGKAVFGVAARPRLIVYPVAVALTVIVAILSAFPLRRLASIRPASVFRGEA